MDAHRAHVRLAAASTRGVPVAASYLLTCTFLPGPPEFAASSLHSLVIALLHPPGAPDELAAVLLYPRTYAPFSCAQPGFRRLQTRWHTS